MVTSEKCTNRQERGLFHLAALFIVGGEMRIAVEGCCHGELD